LSQDQNADPDPDPGTQENANPDPHPGTQKMRIQCGSDSGFETLVEALVCNELVRMLVCIQSSVKSCSLCSGYGIKCWVCRSDGDPKCADPFDNTSFPITDCRYCVNLFSYFLLEFTNFLTSVFAID